VSDQDVTRKLPEMLAPEHGGAFALAAEDQPDNLDVLALPSSGRTARTRRAVTT
jgi:hypothetical protein